MSHYHGKYENHPVEPAHHEKKPARRGMNKALYTVMMVVFSALFLVSGWMLLDTVGEYRASQAAYNDLSSTIVQWVPNPKPQPLDKPQLAPDHSQQTPEKPQQEQVPEENILQVDFDQLTALNPDAVGWIYSKNGQINYPVVHGDDNDYYLTHLIDGTVNKSGSIFADYRNTKGFTDRNTFIYGHHMRDGSMFASINNYEDEAYYAQFPELELYTPEGRYILQVFSGYVTSGNSSIYQYSYESDEEFRAYLEDIRSRSDFSSDVTVTEFDRIVTLSTCTYVYNGARYVVHCKLVPADQPA